GRDQPARPQLEGEAHQARPAHLVALLDRGGVLAIAQSAVDGEKPGERGGGRAGGGILRDAERGRKHPGVIVVAWLGALVAEYVDHAVGKRRGELSSIGTAPCDRVPAGDRHERRRIARGPAARTERAETDVT